MSKKKTTKTNLLRDTKNRKTETFFNINTNWCVCDEYYALQRLPPRDVIIIITINFVKKFQVYFRTGSAVFLGQRNNITLYNMYNMIIIFYLTTTLSICQRFMKRNVTSTTFTQHI